MTRALIHPKGRTRRRRGALRTVPAPPHRDAARPAAGTSACGAKKLARFAGDPRYHLLVGEADSAVISTVTLVIVENLTHGMRPYALIENVVTHRAHRGKALRRACENRRGKRLLRRSCC